jgi:CheY-like chemotaxis protein
LLFLTDDRLTARHAGSPASERSKGELVDAHDLIREVLRGFHQRVRDANLKVALELNARQRTVLAGPSSLASEIASLIDSALGVTSDDGRLVIRTRSREGAPGLQVETSRGGSVFVLDLEGPPPVASSPSLGAAHAAKGPQLLVVDDDADTVVLMRRALERRGYGVITAASVAEGIEAFARNQIDVVISDLGLPDGSGLDLMKTLAKNRVVRGIALTGSSGAEDIEGARAAGFSDHITKPVEIATLERAITRLLGRSTDEHPGSRD